MHVQDAVPVPPSSVGKPTRSDLIFLGAMVFMLAGVGLMGAFTFKEGLKTEASKVQAQAFVDWMTQARAQRSSSNFVPAACAMKSDQAGAVASTWAICSQALLGPGGPLGDARNAFTGRSLQFIARCDPSNAATVGQFAIEKVSLTPAGSAVPVVISPMLADESMDKPLTLRVAICDKGGYSIKVGEAEF